MATEKKVRKTPISTCTSKWKREIVENAVEKTFSTGYHYVAGNSGMRWVGRGREHVCTDLCLHDIHAVLHEEHVVLTMQLELTTKCVGSLLNGACLLKRMSDTSRILKAQGPVIKREFGLTYTWVFLVRYTNLQRVLTKIRSQLSP